MNHCAMMRQQYSMPSQLNMNNKVDHVRAEASKPHGGHLCHGGCGKSCPPAYWGCRGCWYRLPQALRNRIWRTYRPGQESDKSPSPEYLAAATAVQQWIKENPL